MISFQTAQPRFAAYPGAKTTDVNVRWNGSAEQRPAPSAPAGGGAIMQMSSVGGQITAPGFGAYCATKFAPRGESRRPFTMRLRRLGFGP